MMGPTTHREDRKKWEMFEFFPVRGNTKIFPFFPPLIGLQRGISSSLPDRGRTDKSLHVPATGRGTEKGNISF